MNHDTRGDFSDSFFFLYGEGGGGGVERRKEIRIKNKYLSAGLCIKHLCFINVGAWLGLVTLSLVTDVQLYHFPVELSVCAVVH